MSVQAMAWVLEQERTTVGSTRLVLLSIANHADRCGRNAWPSVASIAAECNTSERSVQRAIGQLEEAGLLAVEQGMGGDRECRPDRRPNRYSLPLMPPPDGATSVAPRDPSGAPNGVTLVVERGDTGGRHGVQPVSPKPSLNHPEPSSSDPAPMTDPEQTTIGRRRAIVRTAVTLIAERQVDAFLASGGQIRRSRQALLNTTRNSVEKDHGEHLYKLHHDHPSWTAEQLADRITNTEPRSVACGECHTVHAPADPVCAKRAAEWAAMEAWEAGRAS